MHNMTNLLEEVSLEQPIESIYPILPEEQMAIDALKVEASFQALIWTQQRKNMSQSVDYVNFIEKIDEKDWLRFVRTRRHFLKTKKHKEIQNLKLDAVKIFIEFFFYAHDREYNDLLFDSKIEEQEHYEIMKQLAPIQVYGRDKQGHPVLYQSGNLENDGWKVYTTMLKEEGKGDPNLGYKKFYYYRYKKAIRKIWEKNNEQGNVYHYLSIVDVATLNLVKLAPRNKMGGIIALHAYSEIEMPIGDLKKINRGILCHNIVMPDWAIPNITPIYPDNMKMYLQKYIDPEQIPQDYLPESTNPKINWDDDKPQFF